MNLSLPHEKFNYLSFCQDVGENFKIGAKSDHVVKVKQLCPGVGIHKEIWPERFEDLIQQLVPLWRKIILYYMHIEHINHFLY